jgi:hypothetical protein
MSISKCIVRLKDCHDTEHSVEVYGATRALSRRKDLRKVVGDIEVVGISIGK